MVVCGGGGVVGGGGGGGVLRSSSSSFCCCCCCCRVLGVPSAAMTTILDQPLLLGCALSLPIVKIIRPTHLKIWDVGRRGRQSIW